VANTELILGIAGIAGTLIGSTTGYGSAAWLERLRQAREDRQERREIRTAARLLMDEVARNNASVAQAQPVSNNPGRALFPIEQSNWTQYAHVLATIDDRDTWLAVSTAYTAFAAVAGNNHTVDAGFAPTVIQQADAAVEALRPHV
jgi:hypothetical protein